jgi:hypothetical protein
MSLLTELADSNLTILQRCHAYGVENKTDDGGMTAEVLAPMRSVLI